MAETSRKRWREELPAFLDAASSVSANTYSARRLPELKVMWKAIRPISAVRIDESLQSSGRKTSSRHQRRRTTSYAPRKRHRYPLGKSVDSSSMTITSSNNNSDEGIPSSKITNHDINNHQDTTLQLSLRRKSRRKPRLLRHVHSKWQRFGSETNWNATTINDVNWIPTHLWHAKRFHMVTMFGWRIPIQHTNRGFHAVHRLWRCDHRTLLQDITWRMQPLVVQTQHLQTLVDNMSKVINNFLPPSPQDCEVLEGRKIGEGVLHEASAFPARAVGPAYWWIRQITQQNMTKLYEMHLFIYPSIRSRVEAILRDLFSVIPNSGISSFLGGIACFKLRGESSLKSVKEALHICGDEMKAAENTTHLSILRVQKGFTTKSKLFSKCDTPFSLANDEIILVRQSGDLDSYSGWDLFCSLQDAHDIFMNLAHHPSTVVIGYAEEAKMELSLNPPCPVFPISYPDTDQGNEYWNDASQWKVLHHYISNKCRKRLNLSHAKGVEVDDIHEIQDGSSTLLSYLRKLVVAPSISEIQSSVIGEGIEVVVVRGIYGQPFLQLLEQCHAATFAARLNVMPNLANKQIAQVRRHRRKSLDPYKLRFANRTSEKVAKSRMEHAKVLASNLSLPALLRCHLQVYGRGTLSPMDAIFTSQDSNETNPTMDLCIILGVVLYGSFSEVTGFAEGFGFISAAKLLEYLASCRHPPLMVKSGKPCLLTQVKREPSSKATKALLSLLL